METPSSASSMRRVTRSQTSLAPPELGEKKVQEAASFQKSEKTPIRAVRRPVLVDITNDSPVSAKSSIARPKKTPVATEVKTLSIQKVPVIPFAEDECDIMVPKAAEVEQEEHVEEEQIEQELMPESPEKSEVTDSSTLSSTVTYQGNVGSFPEMCTEDDGCSSAVWSIQTNANSRNEEIEEEVEDYVEEEEDEDDFYQEGDDGVLDYLCEGLMKMSVLEKRCLPEFSGKHTRFVYNSDDEIEGNEEVEEPNVLVLKGLPVPEGKHLRFPEEEED